MIYQNFPDIFSHMLLLLLNREKDNQNKKSIAEKSKFGTYLRYKRVSKYENEIENRTYVLYFL